MKRFPWWFGEAESAFPANSRLSVTSRIVPDALICWGSALWGEISACGRARARPGRAAARGAGAGSGSAATSPLLPPVPFLAWSSSLSPSCSTEEVGAQDMASRGKGEAMGATTRVDPLGHP